MPPTFLRASVSLPKPVFHVKRLAAGPTNRMGEGARGRLSRMGCRAASLVSRATKATKATKGGLRSLSALRSQHRSGSAGCLRHVNDDPAHALEKLDG